MMSPRFFIFLLAVAPLGATSISDGGVTRLTPASSSILLLEGSSNVTDWRCTGKTIEAEMEVAVPIERINAVIDRIEDGNIAVWRSRPQDGRFPPPRFRMQIPISRLRCGNRRMERDLNHALRADEYPAIHFRFTEMRGSIQHDIDRHTYEARVAGDLELAGVRRAIEFAVTAQRLSPTQFRLRATLPLRMTDFEIIPPTALLGMIKAKNELVVRFDLMLVAEQKS